VWAPRRAGGAETTLAADERATFASHNIIILYYYILYWHSRRRRHRRRRCRAKHASANTHGYGGGGRFMLSPRKSAVHAVRLHARNIVLYGRSSSSLSQSPPFPKTYKRLTLPAATNNYIEGYTFYNCCCCVVAIHACFTGHAKRPQRGRWRRARV